MGVVMLPPFIFYFRRTMGAEYFIINRGLEDLEQALKDTGVQITYVIGTVANATAYSVEIPEDRVAEIKGLVSDFYRDAYKFETDYYYDYDQRKAMFVTPNIVEICTKSPEHMREFLFNEILPPAEEVFKEAYHKGELPKPVFLHYGEESYNREALTVGKYEVILTVLSKYAEEDFPYSFDNYMRCDSESLLLKYKSYEKAVDVDVPNDVERVSMYNNYIGGAETTRTPVLNWVYEHGLTHSRVIGMNMTNLWYGSALNKAFATKKFWKEFILPQFVDEDVISNFLLSPILNQKIAISNFIRLLVAKDAKEEAEEKQLAETLRYEIMNYIRTITNKKIQLKVTEDKIAKRKSTLTTSNAMRIKLAKQISEVSKHPYVTSIDIDKLVVIHTTEIKVDGEVPIGPYDIKLDLQGEANIWINNVGNKIGGYDHPHVNEGGPCWGNYSDVYVHLTELDLVSTMEIVFRFLESWNPEDSWGAHLIWWDAKYAFGVFEDMDLLEDIGTGWNDYYRQAFGHDMPGMSCYRCGYSEMDCVCYCQRCGDLIDSDCGCNRCSECGELHESGYSDCMCERCDECGSVINECTCEICDGCGYHVDECECEEEMEEANVV